MTEYLIIRNLFVSNMKLDSNDLKIIELLKQDSRASVTSIAEALGLARVTTPVSYTHLTLPTILRV